MTRACILRRNQMCVRVYGCVCVCLCVGMWAERARAHVQSERARVQQSEVVVCQVSRVPTTSSFRLGNAEYFS